MKWRIVLAIIFRMKLAVLIDHDGAFNYTFVKRDPMGRLWGKRHGFPILLNADGTTKGRCYVTNWFAIYPPNPPKEAVNV